MEENKNLSAETEEQTNEALSVSETNAGSEIKAQKSESESINDKLSRATEAIIRADVEAKLSREEARRDKSEAVKEIKRTSDEARRRRSSGEAKTNERNEKLQAELEYAEAFRKRIRAQKQRAEQRRKQALEAKRAAEVREQSADEREAIAREADIADERNKESDELLKKLSDKVELNEEARQKATEEAERLESERLEAEKLALTESESEDEGSEALPEESMIITDEGTELLPASAFDTEEALEKSEEDSLAELRDMLIGAAAGAAVADGLSDGEKTADEDARPTEPEAAAADTDVADAEAQTPEEICDKADDGILTVDIELAEDEGQNTDVSEYTEQGEDAMLEAAEEPIIEKEAAEDEPTDDFLITMDGAQLVAPTEEPIPENDTEQKGYAYAGVYSALTRKADFGDEFDEKKRAMEESFAAIGQSGDAEAYTPDKKLLSTSYKYDAGNVLRGEDFHDAPHVYEAHTDKTLSLKEASAEKREEDDVTAAIATAVGAGAVAAGIAYAKGSKRSADMQDDVLTEAFVTEQSSYDTPDANQNDFTNEGVKTVSLDTESVHAPEADGEIANVQTEPSAEKVTEQTSVGTDYIPDSEQYSEICQPFADSAAQSVGYEPYTVSQGKPGVEYADAALSASYNAHMEKKLARKKGAADYADIPISADEIYAPVKPASDEKVLQSYDQARERKAAEQAYAEASQKNDTLPYPDLISANDGVSDSVQKKLPFAELNDIYDAELEKKELAKTEIAKAHIRALSARELKRYLKDAKAKEAALLEREKPRRKAIKGRHGMKDRRAVAEYLDVKYELITLYIDCYKTCLGAHNTKLLAQYAEKIEKSALEYNTGLDIWEKITGQNLKRIPSSILNELSSHSEIRISRVIPGDAHDTSFNAKAPEHAPSFKTAPTKRELEEDRERFLKEEVEREALRRESEKRRSERLCGKSAQPQSISEDEAKQITKRAVDALRLGIDTRIDEHILEIKRAQYRFGEKDARTRREERDTLARAKALKRDRRRILKREEQDYKRYFTIILQDPATALTKKRADRARMAEMRRRIISYVLERDSVNKELTQLYYDNGKDGSKKNIRKKIAAVSLAAMKKAYRRLLPDFKATQKLRIVLKDKDRIYEVMNNIVATSGYLAECRFRIRHENPRADAKRQLRSEIKRAQRELDALRRDLARLKKKARVRSKLSPNPKSQIFWAVVGLILVVACVVAYINRAMIFEWLGGLISGFLGG